MYIPIYIELRREDVLCIMEENVEDRSPGGDPLWGTVDYKFERVKINTPFFNFMDFIVNFLDFAYDKVRTSAYVSIRQHTSAYVSIRQHTSAYVCCGFHSQLSRLCL